MTLRDRIAKFFGRKTTRGFYSGAGTSRLLSNFVQVSKSADSETLVIDSGKLTVKDNYFATTGDTRSHAKVMVDKLESLLEGKADADVSSYAIAGRSLNKLTVEEMLKWRDYYKA